MKWKKLEDWFVEGAAFLVLRAICALAGFLIVIFGGPDMFLIYGYGSDVERYDAAFYGWLICAVIVAVVFAIIGPRILRLIADQINDR